MIGQPFLTSGHIVQAVEGDFFCISIVLLLLCPYLCCVSRWIVLDHSWRWKEFYFSSINSEDKNVPLESKNQNQKRLLNLKRITCALALISFQRASFICPENVSFFNSFFNGLHNPSSRESLRLSRRWHFMCMGASRCLSDGFLSWF